MIKINISGISLKLRKPNIGGSMCFEAGYYSEMAFRSNLNSDCYSSGGLTNLQRLNKKALVWGRAKDVVPTTILTKETPKRLRKLEKRPDLLEEIGFDGCFNHGCMRFARLSAFSSFVNFINIIAKLAFYSVFPMSILVALFTTDLNEGGGGVLSWETAEFPLTIAALTLTPWLGSSLLIQLFPKFFIRSGRGPEWELNRRSGLVTVWRYPRKLPFLKRSQPEVIEEPFTEFTPWIGALGDRHGTNYRFELFHRNKDLEAYVGDFLGPQRHPAMCYAYWQFIQNYMDVTKPIPDIPILEKYRHLDPVTAEHDRKTGRPERYWRDMDDETWKQKKQEEFAKVMACQRDF